jgi:hypothetical protein
MIRQCQKGIAILETSAVMLAVLAMLLGSWAAIDIYQQGLTLDEFVEGQYYDGVVGAYRINSSTQEIEVNRDQLIGYLNQKVSDLSSQMKEAGDSESNYKIQSALVEVFWPDGGEANIENVLVTDTMGQLVTSNKINASLDFRQLASDYLTRMSKQGLGRSNVLRPDIWQGQEGSSFITPRVILVGLGVVRKVDNGLGKMLLESIRADQVIVRSSFNVLRKDL